MGASRAGCSRRMRHEGRRTGFTFLEILFLLGIGALLLVIILPVYSAAKMKGKKTACLSNLRQIGLALQLYAQDYDELLPPYLNRRHDESGKKTRWDSPERVFETVQIKAYDPGIMFCTVDPYRGHDIHVFGVNHKYSSYYFHMLPPDSDEGELGITGVHRGGTLIVPPADYLLICDSNFGKPELVDGSRAYGCQHLHGVNAVYLDMHAESLKLDSKDLRNLLKPEKKTD